MWTAQDLFCAPTEGPSVHVPENSVCMIVVVQSLCLPRLILPRTFEIGMLKSSINKISFEYVVQRKTLFFFFF